MGHHDQSGGSVLIAAVGQARRHLDGGRYDEAAAALSRHLSTIDPESAGDDPVLIDAACLYAEAVRDRWDTRLRWAAYAFDASRRLYDAYHPRTLSAARILVELAQGLDASRREPAPERESPDRITSTSKTSTSKDRTGANHAPGNGVAENSAGENGVAENTVAQGTSLLREYLTGLIGGGQTADVRALPQADPKTASH